MCPPPPPMQKTKGNYFLTWALVIHHHSVANHHSSKFGKVMDTCLSSTILLWPLFWEFLQLFYLHFVEYFLGLVFLLGFFTYVEKKSEGRCSHEGFLFWRTRPTSFWHPQVKLSGRGQAGLSPAHHWVWNPDPF